MAGHRSIFVAMFVFLATFMPSLGQEIATSDHVDCSTVPENTPLPTRGSSPIASATFDNGAEQHLNDSEKNNFVERNSRSVLNHGYSMGNNLCIEFRDDIVTWDSGVDQNNPKNWPYRRKVALTFLLGSTTMCSTFASSILSTAVEPLANEYGVSTQVTLLGTSLFIAGYIPGPILWGPLSEVYGRKISILFPMILFVCLTAGTATAENLQTILITRFFGGVCASAPVTTVGGGLADMFNQKQRGTAIVFYALAVIAGPTLGPIAGGAFVQSSLGWRWTMYFIVILTGLITVLDFFFLPETFAPVLLTKKARWLRLHTGRWALHSQHEELDLSLGGFLDMHLKRPLMMLATEPMLFFITLYNSFAYGILYLLFAAVPIVYQDHRGWNHLVGALPFIGVLIGTIGAAAVNLGYTYRVFIPYVEKHQSAEPELRLPPMMIGSVTFPIGFFVLGWTSDASFHWLPGVIGLTCIGLSFLLIFQAGINYLIDSYTKYSASAIAAQTFMRSIFAAGLPLIAQPLFRNLGIDWGCTVLGLISGLLAGVPFVFFWQGKRIRANSRMIQSPDA